MSGIVLFFKTNQAVWCSDVLTSEGINNRMSSVPQKLNSSCGYCVSFNQSDQVDVESVLDESHIEYDRIETFSA